MSDTTTPSAAEVMDVRGRHQFGRSGFCDWCDAPESVTLVAECPDAPLPTPTPDDMLAWLRGRVRAEHPGNTDAIEMWWDPECEDDCYSVTIAYYTWSAPTLHAALEQAVIAVGRGL